MDISVFGKTPNGEEIKEIYLNNGRISCRILTWGAIIRTLSVPDRNGQPVDVVLGYDTPQEYLTDDMYLGAAVGRYSNRIAESRFALDGQTYALSANDGCHHLHGGTLGFSRRLWKLNCASSHAVSLSLRSADGEDGYPGNMLVTITYQLDGNSLSIRYRAVSDAPTPCSLTNHSYFNLAGHASGWAMDQQVRLYADRYAPADHELIPCGFLEPVDGTDMDLRTMVPMEQRIGSSFPQIQFWEGFDHTYLVDGPVGQLRPAAEVRSEKTGIALLAEITNCGMHFYTNSDFPNRKGKEGAVYDRCHCFCLESQSFPNSPNTPAFPNTILRPGEVYDHCTRFTFSTF